MDHSKNCSIQNASKFSRVHFLKKSFQILVSIYVFSLFFSQPSLLNAVLSYLDHYISSFSIKLFHYNTERNYIFLVSNAILAVILKNSGLISNSPMNSSFEGSKREKNHHLPEVSDAEFSKKKTDVIEKAIVEAEEHGRQTGILVTEEFSGRETESTKGAIMEVEEDERKNWILVKDELNEAQIEEDWDIDEDQDEEEQEQEHGLMSTDEFNRKCEEFIKKMREGIKVEFQQIIMV